MVRVPMMPLYICTQPTKWAAKVAPYIIRTMSCLHWIAFCHLRLILKTETRNWQDAPSPQTRQGHAAVRQAWHMLDCLL